MGKRIVGRRQEGDKGMVGNEGGGMEWMVTWNAK